MAAEPGEVGIVLNLGNVLYDCGRTVDAVDRALCARVANTCCAHFTQPALRPSRSSAWGCARRLGSSPCRVGL